MWFSNNNSKEKNSKIGSAVNGEFSAVDCARLLKSIDSNGVSLGLTELVNYQNKTALIDLAGRKNIQGQMSGNYLSRSKGRGMEFDEVRHYQTGDDIRAIDWRVTARTGKTHTKLFREEVERPVLIATDLSLNMRFGSKLLFKSVQASHLASLVAWHAKSRGDRLGGIVFNEHDHIELKPRSRKEGVLHYLHALKSLHQNSEHTNNSNSAPHNNTANNALDESSARLRQLAKPGSLVYLITDGINVTTDTLRHLTHISRHCELVVCLISDPFELDLPRSKIKLNVSITDGTNKQQLTLGDKKTAHHYHQQALSLANKRYQLLIETGARVLNFSAGQTLASQLESGEGLC